MGNRLQAGGPRSRARQLEAEGKGLRGACSNAFEPTKRKLRRQVHRHQRELFAHRVSDLRRDRPASAGVTVPATGSKVIFESLDDGLISSRRPEAACTIRMLNVAATLPCTGAGSDGVPGAGR